MWNRIVREPVALANAARLLLLAGIEFGLQLTGAQLIATMAAFEAVLTLLTRTQVSPNPVVEAALTLPPGSTMHDAVEESIKVSEKDAA